MERYILWGDDIILQKSNLLNIILEFARKYDYYNSPYKNLIIMDTNFDEIIWMK